MRFLRWLLSFFKSYDTVSVETLRNIDRLESTQGWDKITPPHRGKFGGETD